MKAGNGLRVVIINGRPCSGKTTFEMMCESILGSAYCERRSTVDKVKALAAEAGWNGEKTPAARKMLSDLKDVFTAYNDMPFNDIIDYLRGWEWDLAFYNVGNHTHVLFVDDREPEHIDRLKQRLNAYTVLIRRPGDDDEDLVLSNHADRDVFNYSYDFVIENDGSIHDLYEKAQHFLNSIFSENRGIIEL